MILMAPPSLMEVRRCEKVMTKMKEKIGSSFLTKVEFGKP
jgi:hypothetical protein